MKTEGRVQTEVRCKAKGHLLVTLTIRANDHHRVADVPRVAVVNIDPKRPGRDVLSNKLSGTRIDLDDESDPTRRDSLRMACACGSDFELHPSELVVMSRKDTLAPCDTL